MIQTSTQLLEKVLLKFYRKVTANHPKKHQNRQQMKVVLKTVTLKIQSKSNQQQGNYVKKTSLATECSLSEQAQTLIPSHTKLNSQNQLYFTFCPKIQQITQQPREETINFKYRSHSIHKILLYAIFFNYFHIQTLVERLPLKLSHVFNLSQAIIEATSAIMQSIQKQNKRYWKASEGPSLLHLIYYLQNYQYCQERKLNVGLQYLVNGIDDDIVKEILNRLTISNYNGTNQNQINQRQSRKQSQGSRQGQSRPIQADYASFIQQLALSLNIRIKLENKNERLNLGNRRAKICLVVKEQTTKNGFYLKGIVYYKQSERIKSQIGKIGDSSSQSEQFVEI